MTSDKRVIQLEHPLTEKEQAARDAKLKTKERKKLSKDRRKRLAKFTKRAARKTRKKAPGKPIEVDEWVEFDEFKAHWQERWRRVSAFNDELITASGNMRDEHNRILQELDEAEDKLCDEENAHYATRLDLQNLQTAMRVMLIIISVLVIVVISLTMVIVN